jgi:PGDYG protein
LNSSALFFHSSGHPGYSRAILDDAGHVTARKREREVQVRFTAEECTVATNEGLVHARPGDAILTGIAGEHWRVSRAHFGGKYRPLPPTRAFEDGTYLAIGIQILALNIGQAFQVDLADGRSHLSGRPGDWLVDYGDGSLGIVASAIFDDTYEILS